MTKRTFHPPRVVKRRTPSSPPARPKATPVTYACRQASPLMRQAYVSLYVPGMYDHDQPGDQKHVDRAFATALEAVLKLAPFVESMQPLPKVGRNAEDVKDLMARLIDLANIRAIPKSQVSMADPTSERAHFDRSVFDGWTHEEMVDAYVGARTEVLQLQVQLEEIP